VQAAELAGKKLELLREVIIGLHRLAILADASTPAGVLQMSEAEAAATTLSIEASISPAPALLPSAKRRSMTSQGLPSA
jgi:hypothetical protein